jgi:small-conductance mechanosensitive channel
MGEQVEAEVKELEKLEQAAEETTAPEEIQERAAQPDVAVPAKRSHLWFLPYLILLAALGGGIFLLDWQRSFFRPATAEKIYRYLLGGIGVTMVLMVARAVEVYAIGRLRNAVARFNLRRILRLLVAIVLIFIVISVLFVNWYAAAVSLGLISLILGFALQTPISSFIGWIYILVRAPYRVGDRIQIGEARGDVIDVSYLDTTLWEIGGRHLSTDHPSGRLIKFPNTSVFDTPVFNYSWPLFPYVWNEVRFHIAYESDLEFVATTMQKIAEQELGESMMEKVKIYRDLLARTPIDHVEVRERPAVLFRVSENTWLEAIVQYLVHPKEAGRVKTRLTRKLLAALNSAPDRVLFPKSNLR